VPVTERIGVVGASLVGRSWAVVFARAGHEVRLFDRDAAVVEAAGPLIERSLAELAEAGLLREEPAAVAARVIRIGTVEEAVSGVAYVQECASEKLEIKRDLFRLLDAAAPPACILASSTSTIRTSLFAADLPGRERCLVAHPINPPHLARIVELSPAPFTSPEVVTRARDLHVRVGQEPIVVRKEIDGFVLNRLQAALLAEAWRLVDEGYVGVGDLDTTVRAGLGLRWALMGPFETIDLNAPGGIGEYARHYGRNLQTLVEGTPYGPLGDELIERVEAERRAALPAGDLPARTAWRDRQLAGLVAHLDRQTTEGES
jgi:3-hydroxyacyl-CoA dehydrogenase